MYLPVDPEPELLQMTYQGLKNVFEERTPRLFDIAEFSD
jgi:hypothetical protein